MTNTEEDQKDMKTTAHSFDSNDAEGNLTRAEAARYLRISQAHLSNLVHHKVPGAPRLRCRLAGRRMIFRRRWLDEFMEGTREETP
jgi:excisionase family DNA binding protein